VELRDTEIRTRGGNSVGIDVRGGASASAERVSIDTDGDYAHGAYLYGANGEFRIADSAIVTRGKESAGINVIGTPGGTIDVATTSIRTSGLYASGLSISYDGAHATLDRTEIGRTATTRRCCSCRARPRSRSATRICTPAA
jgi:hypothetical protein